MPKKTPPIDTQAYIDQASSEAQAVLTHLTILLRKMQPTEETIKWGQPFFFYKERCASIAAYKEHVSISFSEDLTPEEIEKAKDLGYATGQKRVNIRFDQPIPNQLIEEIITKK